MKNLKTNATVILAVSFFSFTMLKEKTVNVKTSTINWVGKKVTGSHEGTINLQSGVLKFDDNKLVGGEFVIDMSTITVTDLEGKSKNSLEGHLKSDDFFGVENHKTATLKITDVSKLKDGIYEVSSDLTIKGITLSHGFTLIMDDNTAKTTLTIDRTKFGIKYKSGSFFDDLKDKAIYDDFTLDVNLKF